MWRLIPTLVLAKAYKELLSTKAGFPTSFTRAPLLTSTRLSSSRSYFCNIPITDKFPPRECDGETMNSKYESLRKNEWAESHILATDASGSDGGELGGVGVAVYNDSNADVKLYRLDPQTPPNLAELFGLLQALVYTEEHRLKDVIILSDCQQCVKELSTPRHEMEIVQQIQRRACDLINKQGYRIQISWVPGHCGIHPNVQAHRAARRARIEGELVALPLGPTSN